MCFKLIFLSLHTFGMFPDLVWFWVSPLCNIFHIQFPLWLLWFIVLSRGSPVDVSVVSSSAHITWTSPVPVPTAPLRPCPHSGVGGKAGFGSRRIWAVICICETQFLPGSTPSPSKPDEIFIGLECKGSVFRLQRNRGVLVLTRNF